MKPFLYSVFRSLVGLLTWLLIITFVIAVDPDSFWTRILFGVTALVLCWIASYRSPYKGEPSIYAAILLVAFLTTMPWMADGILTSLLFSICFACVAVSSFRSKCRWQFMEQSTAISNQSDNYSVLAMGGYTGIISHTPRSLPRRLMLLL